MTANCTPKGAPDNKVVLVMRIYIAKKGNNNKTLHKKSMAISSKLKDRIADDHKKLLPIMVSGVMKDLGQRSTSWQANC